ncbi:hypothetical protein ZWY2020_021610 [Hordeum vulgare]|nr:hypothetical protein ZWY2020_021610 [Hordeum vulgare]
MDKLEGMEKKFDTKMNAKFNEVLARLPPPVATSVPLQPQPLRLRARRARGQVQNFGVVATTTAAAPPAATAEVSMAEKNEDYDGDYDDEGEVAPVQHQEQQPPRQAAGRPHRYNHNDLKSYLGEEDELPSRMTSVQGEDDEDINTIVTPTSPVAIHTGRVSRARARQLNYQEADLCGQVDRAPT